MFFLFSGAELMHKYSAHGATDVTGFGLLGHAQNLALAQKQDVRFRIEKLPCLAGTSEISQKLNMFGLLQGKCIETSGSKTSTLN